MTRTYLFIPLASAIIYAFAALAIKRSLQLGVGPWRMAFLSNFILFLIFGSFIFFVKGSWVPSLWWPALLSGALFFIGQSFTFWALFRGDVSIATPVLGTKVVLVALFLVLFLGQTLSASVWIAAFMATLGIALLQLGGRAEHRGKTMQTLILSFVSATAFAGADVVVQRWCPEIGLQKFMSISATTTFALSFLLIPFFNAPLWKLPAGSLYYTFIGLFLLAVQSIGVALAIGFYQDAAGTNIVYASRGLWSVLVVWFVGHWFANEERQQGKGAMLGRVIGATLILSAVVLIFV